MNPSALQRYQMRKQGYKPAMLGPGDAEYIDDDVYASGSDRKTETAPTGLVDRLYSEQLNAEPLGDPGADPRRPRQPVPTTKNRFY